MANPRQRGIRALAFVLVIAVLAAICAVALGSFVTVDSRPDVNAELSSRDATLAWISRVFLVLALVWIAIGAIATRTSLVRRPGAAAARATWLSSTRPWRARESMLGLLPLDRALIMIVPAGLLLAARLIQTSFATLWPAFALTGAVMVFAIVMAILVRPRSPWPVLSSVGGVLLLQGAAELASYSVAGPYAFWHWLWQSPILLRVAMLTIIFALVGWAIVAACGAASSQIGPRRAFGAATGAVGAALVVLTGLVIITSGIARGLLWRDEVIAVEAPPALVWALLAVGVVLVVIGITLARSRSTDDVVSDIPTDC